MKTKLPFLRSRYNYDRDAASNESSLHCKDPSLAQQGDKEDADINVLVKRFGVTGTMPQLNREALDPNQFHEITDFHQAVNAIKDATHEFMKMPADIRRRFQNDPHEFLAFVHDDKNREEADRLGITKAMKKKPDAAAPGAGAPPPAPPGGGEPPAPPAGS